MINIINLEGNLINRNLIRFINVWTIIWITYLFSLILLSVIMNNLFNISLRGPEPLGTYPSSISFHFYLVSTMSSCNLLGSLHQQLRYQPSFSCRRWEGALPITIAFSCSFPSWLLLQGLLWQHLRRCIWKRRTVSQVLNRWPKFLHPLQLRCC